MDSHLNSVVWKNQMIELLEANDLSHKEAMIRIQCWREGGRGYTPDSSKVGWMIQASEIKSGNAPLKLMLAETRCIPSSALERKYKLSNGLNYILAAKEAAEQRVDDSVMLTINGSISETTSANIFWIKDDQVFSPAKECDLLPGITRQIIIELIESKSNGFEFTEGIFQPEDIKKAEAVFCSNSLIELREVASFADVSFGLNNPLIMKLKESFEQFKRQELKT
jgi:branched-subunit amino acid aminotransferase/4-amino-4-deoxychorismate lyase